MYFLKLIKGKTYWGIVKASQNKPIVCVPEKEQADMLVKSGFFVIIEDPMTEGEEKSCIEENEEGRSGDFASPDDEEEVDQEGNSTLMELQQKTKAELSEYAEMHGIDLTGCKTKDDVISKIVEEMAKASVLRQAIRNSEEV